MPVATWSDLNYPGRATDFFARRAMPVFEPNATGFSAPNAAWLAELSRITYADAVGHAASTRDARLLAAGFRTLHTFDHAAWGIHALLVQTTHAPFYTVLAFRGTVHNWRNYVIDADLGLGGFQRKQPGIHRGFQRALDGLWPQIAPALNQLPPDCPLFFTGHSLGAALAVLAATRHTPQGVYAFGCPRVGNAAFAATTQQLPIYRVVHGADLVTCVPPAWLGFSHVGQAHVLPGESEAQSLASPTWATRLNHPPRLMGHHAPIHYIDQITGLD